MPKQPAPATSAESLLKPFRAARNRGTPLLAIQTPDQFATMARLTSQVNHETPFISWDVVRGFTGLNERGSAAIAKLCPNGGEEAAGMLMVGCKLAAGLHENCVLFVLNAQRHVDEAMNAQAICNLRDQFKVNGRTLVLLGPQVPLPAELQSDFVVLDEPLPGRDELLAIIRDVHGAVEQDVNPAQAQLAVDAVQGLPAFAAEQVTAMSMDKSGLDVEALWERKRQAIEQTPGLIVDRFAQTFDDIGGLWQAKKFGSRLFDGPRRPAVVCRIEEIEKVMAGAAGDTSGVSQDALQVILNAMEDHDWTGVVAFGPPGCQPAGSRVLMADGQWSEIQNLKLGDVVISPQRDGTTTNERIIGLASYLDQEIVSIEIKGGKRYRCSTDHVVPHIGLWRPTVNGIRQGRESLYREHTVTQLLLTGKRYREKARVFTSPAVELPQREYIIHPYIVGAFLGDGSWSASKGAAPSFTTADELLIGEMESLGVRVGKRMPKKGSKASSYCFVKDSRKHLESIGLRGIVGRAKHVPEQYMTGSIDQRLDLLAGMIDTDGTREEWASISPKMTSQFVDLVHSVGGYAIARERGWTDSRGRSYRHFRVTFSFSEYVPRMRLAYKQPPARNMKWKNPRNRTFRITPEGSATVYGFTLSGESRCYVTDDWIVTHNSGKSLYSKALARTFNAFSCALDLGATRGSLVGQSEGAIRRAMKVIHSVGGGNVFFVATANKLDAMPPELRRRFRYGVWFFDAPDIEERAVIWRICKARYKIAAKDSLADDDGFTGADIRNVCEMAYGLKCSLAEASEFLAPICRTTPQVFEDSRRLANGRFLSASYPGLFRMDRPKAADGKRKLKVDD